MRFQQWSRDIPHAIKSLHSTYAGGLTVKKVQKHEQMWTGTKIVSLAAMLAYKASKIDRSIAEGMMQHDVALGVAFTICDVI